MAITINFKEEYKDLISSDIPKTRLVPIEHRDRNYGIIPEKYRKNFIHTPNGFVAQYCEEYDVQELNEED